MVGTATRRIAGAVVLTLAVGISAVLLRSDDRGDGGGAVVVRAGSSSVDVGPPPGPGGNTVIGNASVNVPETSVPSVPAPPDDLDVSEPAIVSDGEASLEVGDVVVGDDGSGTSVADTGGNTVVGNASTNRVDGGQSATGLLGVNLGSGAGTASDGSASLTTGEATAGQ